MATEAFPWPGLDIAAKTPNEQKLRAWANRVNQGKINATGSFGLNPSTAVHRLNDPRLTAGSHISLSGMNSVGGVLIAAGWWQDTQGNGTARLSFQTTGGSTALFRYSIIG